MRQIHDHRHVKVEVHEDRMRKNFQIHGTRPSIACDASRMGRITNRKLLGMAAIVLLIVVVLSWLSSKLNSLFGLI